jgi:hypothetical protein
MHMLSGNKYSTLRGAPHHTAFHFLNVGHNRYNIHIYIAYDQYANSVTVYKQQHTQGDDPYEMQNVM